MDVNDKIRRAVDKAVTCRHDSGWTCQQLNCGYATARALIAKKLTERFEAREWSWGNAHADITDAFGQVSAHFRITPAESARFLAAVNNHLPARLRFTEPARTPQAS